MTTLIGVLLAAGLFVGMALLAWVIASAVIRLGDLTDHTWDD